jgi:hypothetical protein
MENKFMGGWFRATLTDRCLWISMIGAGLIAFGGNEHILRSVISNVGSAMVDLSGALLGIVIAGLAIFIVFLDKKYVALLQKVTSLDKNIWPFKWVAILTVLSLLLGMFLILVGNPPSIIFRILVGVALWCYFYLLFEIYHLIKFLTGHLRVRAKQIALEDEDGKT